MHKQKKNLAMLAVGLLIAAPLPAQAQGDITTKSDRVLLVVSSHGADGGKTRPGFEMDELSQAYAVFADNGLTVDIASPAGGVVVADAFDPKKPYNSRFIADTAAQAKLTATRTLASARGESYAAVFVVGGKGAMFDLPVNTDLKTLIAQTYEAGGVIGAVCHGPAVLMNVPMKDGKSLIAGRGVTGMSNEEELLFGKRWIPAFPVLLEDGLRGAGARFSAAPMMLNHVVADGRIVTGQNPFSTYSAAEALLRAMGRKPAPREPFADERSIALIGRMLAGEVAEARQALKANPAHYDVPLIAAWGLYRSKTPGADRKMIEGAITAMEVALPHYDEPRLVTAIAEARGKLATAS
ncbi:MAG: type 1 glutamine amidotransferase domain-containing protein [Alphaproteobacteria bacterium]|nr:type 1 glutamine amidotransferase domain-containing protein [Alphaproteobacteria bacterium]MBU0864472.1 type 1 glutamine amidotransferase domain-containing protein [Alphaproteobacteria bacterium]MBU1823604.1 type 1 glutamine amidotransferase domain-containing protein [Alphaproteobacteria bacterium]